MIDNIDTKPVSHHTKTRLSLTVFARFDDVFDALKELCAIGVSPDHMLVGARVAESIELANQATARAFTAVLPLLTSIRPTQDRTADSVICASDPKIWQQIAARQILSNGWDDGAHRHGLTRRLSLVDEVGNGSTVLIVRAISFSQHRRSVRILLKHGSSRVSTHEFVDKPAPDITSLEDQS